MTRKLASGYNIYKALRHINSNVLCNLKLVLDNWKILN